MMATAIAPADSLPCNKPGQHDMHCDEAELDAVCAGISRCPRSVVVVTSSPEGPLPWNLALFDLLDADVIIIESTDHAYSRIKQVMPSLIMILMDEDDVGGYQLLSMLKLDRAVAQIPVISCALHHQPDELKAPLPPAPAALPALGST